MSDLHLKKIKSSFERTYSGKVDLSDVKKAEEKPAKFLTRSLVLCALELVCEVPPDRGAQYITDGFGDNGIDGVYFHPEERSIYLLQSKWSDKGTKTIDVGDVHKFIKGAKDILDNNKAAFTCKRILDIWSKIELAVQEAIRIQLVIVFNSNNPLSNEAQAVIDAYKKENNEPTELIFSRVVSQADLFAQVTGTANADINIEAPLFSWGKVSEPYGAVYGQMYCAEIATWYARFGDRLFAPNIRSFLGDTEVNQRIRKTLEDNPSLFWYFNNGITATCDTLARKPGGGADFSSFTFKNLRIVNGAQTVGAIHSFFQDAPKSGGSETATVSVKVISLSEADSKLGNEITVNTNTQNRVNARDFIALEKIQYQLKEDLELMGIQYIFKAGETVPDRSKGFDLDEAVVSLACSMQDLTYAVLAKRNIGVLVSNEKTGKYGEIFTDGITGEALWQKVKTLRDIDSHATDLRTSKSGRDAQLLVHGNRILAHCVFRAMASQPGREILELTTSAATALAKAVEAKYPDSYMAVLFKNTEKCAALVAAVMPTLKPKAPTAKQAAAPVKRVVRRKRIDRP